MSPFLTVGECPFWVSQRWFRAPYGDAGCIAPAAAVANNGGGVDDDEDDS